MWTGKERSCVVIGGGLAGLTAATALEELGVQSLVLERSEKVGGRLRTETRSGGVWDLGTQFLTVRDPGFADIVTCWVGAGLVREWCRGFGSADHPAPTDGHIRYCAVDGMQAMAEKLSADLEVRTSRAVVCVQADRGRWVITTDAGEVFSACALIVAVPAPDALAIFSGSRLPVGVTGLAELYSARYERCITASVLLDGPGAVPFPGGLQLPGDGLSWVGDNHAKGISPRPGAITVHASPRLSDALWVAPDDEVVARMLAASRDWLGAPIISAKVNRWAYSRPCGTINREGLLHLRTPPLALAGDAFVAPRIEGAVLSGLRAAKGVVQALGAP